MQDNLLAFFENECDKLETESYKQEISTRISCTVVEI